MILSYNRVPFKESYRQSHNILDDLSNAYLCYNWDKKVFNDVEEGWIKYLPVKMFVDLHYFNESVGNFIYHLANFEDLPFIYNQFQSKWETYICFNNEEKNHFNDSFLSYLWAQRYVKKHYDDGNIYYEYNTYNSPDTEKFYMYNVLISNLQINNYIKEQEENNE